MVAGQQWEGQVINGKFPLRQHLGSSEHSAVYLTEIDGLKAAIKLVPSNEEHAQVQLLRWESVRKLSHPHLIPILDAGRWRTDNEDLLFVVMEYADENLAEVLSTRALSAAEVSEMLVPALDAIDYVHGRSMVVGDIKPANIMAVNDRLKLASDAIRPVSTSKESAEIGDAYAPPENARGEASPSGDIWSLGMTLVEALTNHLPAWDRTDENDPTLPENLPAPFDDIARHCLRRDPGRRWSTAEIRARLGRPPAAANAGVPMPSAPTAAEGHEILPPATPGSVPSTNARPAPIERREATQNRSSVLVATAAIILVAAIAAGVSLLHHRSEPAPPASAPTTSAQQSAEPPVQPAKSTTVRASKTNPGKLSQGAVIHEVLPDVPAPARNTINGTVTVKVKVAVEASGKVSQATLASRGPSEYFANLALQAARKWTFAAPSSDGKTVPSEWSLTFEFKRNGTQVHPQRTSPSR